ncbi:anti-sigma factor family protein [Meridianimarinicoccus aquatilis]|uniref:Anti-sigma factor n=1 Tax=Meridianimarinicoccus aquatilis TaxID=2552766 RepID=A0A4R6ASG0_9RHOB|nr:anti-sigma factor [Fluviibacterium aquatile]TDL86917.1 anti-sigma factor [Fluviibacterium aquatile]
MSNSNTLDLNAYLDGEIGPDEAAEIEAQLETDSEARKQFDADARHKNKLGEALAALDRPTTNLRTARLERRLAHVIARQMNPAQPFKISNFMRSGARVAAVCALVSFGWIGHAVIAPSGQGVPEYVSEAVGAHQVFAEDMLHPAEFTGAAVTEAAVWFSNKIGVPVAAPDLGARGLTLVGARLLGTKEGPLAQFIYEDDRGDRLSLTLAKHPDHRPIQPLQVVDYPNRAVGYWSTPNLDYAIVGHGNSDAVQLIAQDVAKNI